MKIKEENSMYIEFIIIYILLVIAIGLLVANLVVSLKNKSGEGTGFSNNATTFSAPVQQKSQLVQESQTHSPAPQQSNRVVFCKKCAHQYPANEKFCPNCGNPRS